MKICVNEIIYAFSVALDAVEGELIGASSFHGQRVAYMSALMAKKLGLSDVECTRVAVAAVMHDNALTEYIQGEIMGGTNKEDVKIEHSLGSHCLKGEENVKSFPFYDTIEGAILYHHENADGSGPFGKKADETPIFARIIHIADMMDVIFSFKSINEEKYEKMKTNIRSNTGKLYDEGIAELFLQSVTVDVLENISGGNITAKLFEMIPRIERDYSGEDLNKFATMFARIIDYKSPFTTRHSQGIAEKARAMSKHYGWDEETCEKMYFAGAMHDIGKLMVDNDILEKPGKLTLEEYEKIKDHALGTYVILNSINGFSDITSWASLHHEKLNGSGYPFGYKAEELGQKERLMTCLDIYQALTEPRPYKDGMPHEKVISILREDVEKGALDGSIVDDIDKVFGSAS